MADSLFTHCREALNSGNFEAAAGYVDTFMDLEEKYGPVRDGDGQQAAEQEQVSVESIAVCFAAAHTACASTQTSPAGSEL